MADFDLAIQTVLSDEGGLVEDPHDPGGTTNFGISLRFYRENIDKMASKEVIEKLTSFDAKKIYLDYFWRPNRYTMIQNQQIATKVFDLAVNIGSKHANQCLQRAVKIHSDFKIDTDGVLGGQSFFAINKCPQDVLYQALKIEASSYYRKLVEDKPELGIYLKGWLNRCYRDV